MSKTKIVVFILLPIALVIGLIKFIDNYVIHYHENIKSKPKAYCYAYYKKAKGPCSVIVLENLSKSKYYIEYYEQVFNGLNPPMKGNIPIKGLPPYEPVYIVDYSKDSLLVEVVSYYDRGAKLGGSYTRGYVYYKTIHKNPPTD